MNMPTKSKSPALRAGIRLLRKAARRFRGGALVDLYRKGVLSEVGWFDSYRTLESIDANGQPLPWYTYSFIDFLDTRLSKELRVFEFGSGNSTIWYSERVKEVVAVEHDKAWAEKLSPRLPSNAAILLEEEEAKYISAVSDAGPFDIVVIDGMWRESCAPHALAALTNQGVLIWDNSDRAELDRARHLFQKASFRELRFTGFAPTSPEVASTSVLYRSSNCLGI